MKRNVLWRHRGEAPVPGVPVEPPWSEWRFVGRSIVAVLPWVLPVMMVALLLMLLSGCGQLVGGGGRGSSALSIVVAEPGAVGVQSSLTPQPELVAASYLFSGSGPNGDSFSMTSSNGSVTVPGLAAGRWTIRVEALNADEVVILAGESQVDVEPNGEAALDVALNPLEGHGSLLVEASWNAEHTIAPAATVSITGPDGETSLHQLALVSDSDGGDAARTTVEDLPTGLYRVTVRLYDDDYRVMGSAAGVRVVHGLTVLLSTQFSDINKIGLPIEITDESFSIAWDEPEEHAPSHYRVYNRTRGEYEWSLMAEISAAAQPQFTVTRELLEYGTYELAVSSLVNGDESPMHTSMADDAQPGSGWYVRWLGPQ